MRLSALGLILVLAILAVLLPPLAQSPTKVPRIGVLLACVRDACNFSRLVMCPAKFTFSATIWPYC